VMSPGMHVDVRMKAYLIMLMHAHTTPLHDLRARVCV
jgi:hypothetical protein